MIDSVVLSDPKTKRSRGFGFVTFADPVSYIDIILISSRINKGKKKQCVLNTIAFILSCMLNNIMYTLSHPGYSF